MKQLLQRLLGQKTLKTPEAVDSQVVDQPQPPDHQIEAERWVVQGNALEDAGQPADAEAYYRQALALCPGLARAWVNLGNAQSAQGQTAAAMESYREALRVEPSYGMAYGNLGRLALEQKDYPAAVDCFAAAVQALPGSADAQIGLGCALEASSRLAEAEQAYRQALTLQPGFPGAKLNLGHLLLNLGKADLEQNRSPQAIERFTEAAWALPDSAEARVGLGLALQNLERTSEAEQAYRQALAIQPDHLAAKANLGRLLVLLKQPEQAADYLQEVLSAIPDHWISHAWLGQAMINMNFIPEGLKHICQAVQLGPSIPEYVNMVPFYMNTLPDYTPEEVFTAHVNYIQQFYSQFYPTNPVYSNQPNLNRRLKIGYVSGDFFAHPVSRFVEPVWVHHDRARFEIYGFNNYPTEDWVTDRLHDLTDVWHPISTLTDEAVAHLVRDLGIDILVDLSGYTERHRLGVFARKPAPVQATWLGYLSTTGLATMDYRICDVYTDPPGLTERFHTEQLARLPDCQWCHIPYEDLLSVAELSPELLEVSELPLLSNGYLTLGSFNNASKLNDQVLALWAEVLKATPGSHLHIAAVPPGRAQQRIVSILGAVGVAQEYIKFIPRLPYPQYLASLAQVDLALDPFPYNGGTTSFDILIMGVPLITLAGERSLARGGVSLLSNLGLPELIAAKPQDYVAIVRRLATDPVRLAALRASLRERVRASPLMDGARFTHSLETLYRQMWETWCTKQVSIH